MVEVIFRYPKSDVTEQMSFTDLSNASPMIYPGYLANKTVYTGENATFQCDVLSALTPYVVWVKFDDPESPDHTILSVRSISSIVCRFKPCFFQSMTILVVCRR